VPKETFFNLDEKKRQHIMEVVIDEFAAHEYKSASISKICQVAGIAKGSFYQYFQNKKDLYRVRVSKAPKRPTAILEKY